MLGFVPQPNLRQTGRRKENSRKRSPVVANPRIFGYTAEAGSQTPARQSGKVVRGGSWNNDRDNARCAIRNRNQPDNRNDNLGFRVVLRGSHVLPSLLLVLPGGGAAQRATQARPRSGNAGRSAHADSSAEAKEEEQRQTRLVRAQAVRQGDTGASPAPGAYRSLGTAWPKGPPCPLHSLIWPQGGRVLGAGADFVCRIQPPSSLPTSATMRLTW